MLRKILIISLSICFMGCAGCALCSSPGNSADPIIAKLIHGTDIEQVRYKNWMWNCFVDELTKVQVGDTLFVNKEEWERLIANRNILELSRIIVHEATHAARQCNMGLLTWLILYGTDPAFRWEEEKIASVAEWRIYLKLGGRGYNCEWWAGSMSSSTYNYMVSYEDALKFAKSTMEKLVKDHDAIIFENL